MTEIDAETRAGIAELAGGDELEPAAVARLVAEMPEETMRELVTGEVLTAACEQIIRRFPDYVDAERTARRPRRRWLGDHRRRPGRALPRRLRRRQRRCRPRARARAAGDAELDAVDFLRLATGNADPATLYLSGRLGLSGDELFAIEMASFMRIPGAEGETRAERRDRPQHRRRGRDRRRRPRRARGGAAARDAGSDPRADPGGDLPPLPRVLQARSARWLGGRDRVQDHRPRRRRRRPLPGPDQRRGGASPGAISTSIPG